MPPAPETAHPSPRRAGLRTALLALGATLLALLGVELVLRAAEPPPPPLPPAAAPEPGLPVFTTLMQLATPNQRGIHSGVPYRTNAQGVRGPEVRTPKPPGTYRVLVVGDSVAMGSGVREEDAYAARIARALQPASGATHVEVINAGLAGLTATQVVNRLRRVGVPYGFDLLVYGYTLNDIEGASYRRGPTKPGDPAMPPSGLRVAAFLRSRLYSLRELLAPPDTSYVHELDEKYLHNPAAVADVDAALAAIAATAREQGACAVLFLHTALYFLNPRHPHRRHYDVVADLARQRGFVVVPSLELFLGRDPAGLWVNPFDPHPNAEGHRLLAEALVEGLRQLPPACHAPWTAAGAVSR